MAENKSIEIYGVEIPDLIYKGQRVIMMKDIDRVHRRPEGTARKRFNSNKNRFIEGEDYFDVPYREWSKITAVRFADGGKDTGQRNPIRFIAESGYLMLVKLFTDDLAWKIQRMLVKSYFRARSYEQQAEKESSGRPTKEQIENSARLFETVLNTVELLNSRKRRDVLLTANRITRDSTGIDLVDLIRPELKKEPHRPRVINKNEKYSPNQDEEMLAAFAELWWEAFADHPIYTNQLCPLLSNTDIVLFPGQGKCNTREHAICLSRILSRIEKQGKLIGGYRIEDAGTKRNMRLWRLVKSAEDC